MVLIEMSIYVNFSGLYYIQSDIIIVLFYNTAYHMQHYNEKARVMACLV